MSDNFLSCLLISVSNFLFTTSSIFLLTRIPKFLSSECSTNEFIFLVIDSVTVFVIFLERSSTDLFIVCSIISFIFCVFEFLVNIFKFFSIKLLISGVIVTFIVLFIISGTTKDIVLFTISLILLLFSTIVVILVLLVSKYGTIVSLITEENLLSTNIDKYSFIILIINSL